MPQIDPFSKKSKTPLPKIDLYGGVELRLHVAVWAADLALDAPVLLASHRVLDALGALGTALVVPRAPSYNPLCSWFEA